MRHLYNFFKSLLKGATGAPRRDRGDTRHAYPSPDTPDSHIEPLEQREAESNKARPRAVIRPRPDRVSATKSGSPKWWASVAVWGIHGNDEFTKWWNHWMSRIPHSGSGFTPNHAPKNDV